MNRKLLFLMKRGHHIVPSPSTALRPTFDLKIAMTLIGMCDPKFQSLMEFTTQHYHR
mgnify:CR=1 FL=1